MMDARFVNRKSEPPVKAHEPALPVDGLAILAKLIARALMTKQVYRSKTQDDDNDVAFQVKKQETRLSNNTKKEERRS